VSASVDQLRAICEAAVAGGVTPGLVVLVGQGGVNRQVIARGQRQVDPSPLPISPATQWDLSSLTKALATSVLAMQALDAGRLELDEPLPHLPPPAEGELPITVRRALSHSTGWPAHLKFYLQVLGAGGSGAGTLPVRTAVLETIRRTPRSYPADSRSVYSDLAFMLLGDFLEHRLGGTLDQLTRERIAGPLGLGDLGFRPIAADGTPLPGGEVAATQRCPLRGRVLVGEVDDLNAYALGGVAGHAGLFGTATAVAAVAHALCAAYRAPGRSLVDGQLLRAFWQPAGVPGSTGRLGWDGPAASGSLAGDRIARTAVGHLGFTGCSLWIDPEREAFVVMLSNRVHPVAREDDRFRQLRRAVNDAALAAIGY
jgi:CubicO group peptidase (beta-lactamase class C family)